MPNVNYLVFLFFITGFFMCHFFSPNFEFWITKKWPFFPVWRCGPTRAMASSLTRFLDHTQRRTTVGRTPLDEWSARRRDLYLKTHNIHNRQTSMHPVGLEPTISARERPQTYALDRAATGTGRIKWLHKFIVPCILSRKNEIKTTLSLVLFALFRPNLTLWSVASGPY